MKFCLGAVIERQFDHFITLYSTLVLLFAPSQNTQFATNLVSLFNYEMRNVNVN